MSGMPNKVTPCADPTGKPVKPKKSSTAIAHLAAVLKETIPSRRCSEDQQRLGDADDEALIWYGNKHFPRIRYVTKTPEGYTVEVTMPDPEKAHIRDESGNWQNPKADDLWQCTAHALGTWDVKKRMGYVVDIQEGIWAVLNDPAIAEVIMKPSLYPPPACGPGTLLKEPQAGDIFVVWEHEKVKAIEDPKSGIWNDTVVGAVELNGRRPACHAVRIVKPCFAPSGFVASDGSIGTLDMVNTRVSSKNGNHALQENISLDEIVKNPDYKKRSHGIYRLKGDFKHPLSSWKDKQCDCSHCSED